MQASQADARAREAAATIPVYGQLPFVPVHASGCDIITGDGRRILDLYGGHAVAALGYGHPRLVAAIRQQSETLLFQSNAVALDVRAQAAEKLVSVAPASMERVFFANSGAEANENALRMACSVTQRSKVLAITHGFHGRTAAGTPTSGTGFRKNRSRSTSFRVTTVPRPSR
jgi:4-aminobutyrate aminotransferase-like enzyme